jgi:D-3-phosphoglycerate dehydrogenase / 2-oxoglutarate reductase
VLAAQMGVINMVSAPIIAKERGIKVDEVKQTRRGAYGTYIRLAVKTEKGERSVAGTVFSDGKPRIIQVKGIELESDFGKRMLYITNNDKPGFIGNIGTLMGNAGINIACFHFGRVAAGADAIGIVEVDADVPAAVLEEVNKLPNVKQVKVLNF